MEQRTLRYFLLFSLLSLFFHQSVWAQTNKKDKDPGIAYPLLNGLYIGADLYGVGEYAMGGDFLSSEASVELDLKNRYFPIVEIGYGTTDTWNDRGIHYKGSAPYFRIGMNYNFFYKKQNKYYLYGGFRYAVSSFSYDVANATVNDPIWGTPVENPNINDPIWGDYYPYNYKGQKGSMHWVELLAGVRVHIYKNFHMGWTLRYKSRIQQSVSQYGDPWYVPGFGEFDKSKFGITYTIMYKIPIGK